MKTKLILIPPIGTPALSEIDLPEKPTMEELNRYLVPLLGGGRVLPERVRVLADFTGNENWVITDMFVDENGDAKGLPRNSYATTVYRRATMLGKTPVPVPADPDDLPWIAGPAVLFEREVWF